MNRLVVAVAAFAVCASACLAHAADPEPARTINVVVVTGGHAFDTKAFPRLFEGYPDLHITFAAQKDDSELFEDISDWKYDVIVFYNMSQKISPKRQANLLTLLDRGVGVVALHHAIGAFGGWDEWRNIIGGKFFHKDEEIDGTKYTPSKWKDDVDHKVRVEDAEHPITKGMKDFQLVDETYKAQWVDPKAKLLLTTDDPTSDKALAWAKTFRKSRTCYIQLGHGPVAYKDANYRQIVINAIRWATPPQPAK